MQFSPLELLLGESTFSVAAAMQRLTDAALLNAGTIVLLGAFLVAMASHTQETSQGLPAVHVVVTEPLAVVALL
jgi:hypothetical protein